MKKIHVIVIVSVMRRMRNGGSGGELSGVIRVSFAVMCVQLYVYLCNYILRSLLVEGGCFGLRGHLEVAAW